MDRREVLAGFDASPAAERAVRWAAVEAGLREVPLRVCHAWSWPYPERPENHDAMRVVRGMAALALDDGQRIAREAVPGLEVRPVLLKGTASGALLVASMGAALIVVGSRGVGGFDRLPLGSTAVNVPAHADRPVVVVPAESGSDRANQVVVGVDGSPASAAALRFALQEARLRDAVVRMVCAWWDPSALPSPEQLPRTDPQTVMEQAKARFTSVVAPCLVDYPDVAIEDDFVQESPARALADQAREAVLLVVGDRGLGSSPTSLLGGVARAVLHDAPAPVAIVHERDPRAD